MTTQTTSAFRATPAAELASYRLLVRILEEQCQVVTDTVDQGEVQIKEPADVPCQSVQNPADPDASYNAHRGQGYMAQIAETYEEEEENESEDRLPSKPDLITHVAVHNMTKQDWQALEPALEDPGGREVMPESMLRDTHYGSEGNIRTATKQGVELISPASPPKGSKQGRLTLEQFELDEEGLVIKCPQGHSPITTSAGPTRFEVPFDPAPCDRCTVRSQCPAYSTARTTEKSRWQYTRERVQTRTRRLRERTDRFQDRYRWRAGVEATMSRLKHQMGLAKLRVRGMAAVSYAVFLRALGLNIHRVAAFLGAT